MSFVGFLFYFPCLLSFLVSFCGILCWFPCLVSFFLYARQHRRHRFSASKRNNGSPHTAHSVEPTKTLPDRGALGRREVNNRAWRAFVPSREPQHPSPPKGGRGKERPTYGTPTQLRRDDPGAQQRRQHWPSTALLSNPVQDFSTKLNTDSTTC